MTTIAIVGAGLMGTAMAFPLADNGHSVNLVGTHLDGEIIRSCKESRAHPRLKRTLPEVVRPFFVEEMDEALEVAEMVVSGVSSLGVRWIGRTIAPYLRPGQVILAVTKGLEATADGRLQIMPDVLASELPAGLRESVIQAAIGGPCIAGELAGHRPTCVVFGSRHVETLPTLVELFGTSYYHIWTTEDLEGLEYGAALKNAFALAVGMADGLLEKAGGVDETGAAMHNLAASLFAEGCTEIDRVLEIVGATRAYAHGLPGAGDLYVSSRGGRTTRLGRLLGLGHKYRVARQMLAGETLEGAEVVRSMARVIPEWVKRGILAQDELPLLRMLIRVIVEELPADLGSEAFFGGSPSLQWVRG